MKRIFSLLFALVMIAAVLVLPASAANIKNKDYYNEYVSAGTWHTTNAYYKENDSKVYVYPKTSPTYYTNTQTWCYDTSGNYSNKTVATTVSLPRGTECVISNYVYEYGKYTSGYGVLMWLRLTPNSGAGTLYGCWSPDWSETGSVSYY